MSGGTILPSCLELCLPQGKGGKQDIWQNQFIEEPEVFKAPRVAMMSTRDAQCFDHMYYRDHNHDLKAFTDEQLWHHYRHSGQFEPRPMR